MEEIKQGIVINCADRGESDRFITLLTAEGLAHALLRGAKKPTAKLRSFGQLFAFGEFSLAPSRYGSGYVVTGGQLVDSFFRLTEKSDRYFYGCLFLEIADRVTVYAESTADILVDLLRALQYLTYSEVSPEAVAVKFILKVMSDLGYRQHVKKCSVCGKEPVDSYYDAKNGGLQCENCHTGRRMQETIARELKDAATAEWSALEKSDPPMGAAAFMIRETELLLDFKLRSAASL